MCVCASLFVPHKYLSTIYIIKKTMHLWLLFCDCFHPLCPPWHNNGVSHEEERGIVCPTKRSFVGSSVLALVYLLWRSIWIFFKCIYSIYSAVRNFHRINIYRVVDPGNIISTRIINFELVCGVLGLARYSVASGKSDPFCIILYFDLFLFYFIILWCELIFIVWNIQ